MTRSLVGEIKTLLDVYQGDQSNKKEIIELYNENFDFAVRIKDGEFFPEKKT